MTLKDQWFKECGKILKIGIPITIAQLLNVSMSFVDTVMTGNYSPEALAAVSGSHNMIIPFQVFGIAAIGAAQAIVAQYMGSSRAKEEIGRVIVHSLTIGLVFSVLLILLSRIATQALPFFGFEPSVINLADEYLFAFSWGLPATMVFIAFAGFYAGISKPIMTMFISIIMLSVNIVGNYTLIFGHFGFPELGAAGAGWTSTLAAWSGTIGIILVTVFNREIKQFNPFKLKNIFDGNLFRHILKIGIPSGFSSIFEVSMFAVFSLLMGRFGFKVLAGSQIALNFTSFVFMIPLGLSFAVTTVVGNHVGREDFRKARFAGLSGYSVNILFNICSATLLIVFAGTIAGIYTSDPELIAIASTLLIYAGIFQLSDGAQVAGLGVLRGYKDTKIPMISNLISYWGIGMTLGYFLGFILDYQAKGMWIGIIIGLSVAAILHGIRFKLVSGRYINNAR
jgi:MATE family, multidrug efflux pump